MGAIFEVVLGYFGGIGGSELGNCEDIYEGSCGVRLAFQWNGMEWED